jgi:hypothetical protein
MVTAAHAFNRLQRIAPASIVNETATPCLNKFKCAHTEISKCRLVRSIQFGGPTAMRDAERMMILSDQRKLGDCRKRNTAKNGKSIVVVSMHMNDLMGVSNFRENS